MLLCGGDMLNFSFKIKISNLLSHEENNIVDDLENVLARVNVFHKEYFFTFQRSK